MTMSARTCIESLALLPHPEGGYYRETYRSAQTLTVCRPASGTPQLRHVSTGIYFLLEAGDFSAFHRIESDEMWHFYAGQALNIWELDAAGTLTLTRLGPDLQHGDAPQHVVPAGTWFASRVAAEGKFALVGCTVSPGFDFADFQLANGEALSHQYPLHQKLISELTRPLPQN